VINFADITSQLFEILQNDNQVSQYFRYMSRGMTVNQDPALTPWLGVYRKSIDYEASTIQSAGRQWKAEIQITILVQAASMKDGQDAEEMMEEGVNYVIGALNDNKTINGKVLMMTDIGVEYAYNPDMPDEMSYQQGEITVTYEVRS
jgi:hypothetical protein